MRRRSLPAPTQLPRPRLRPQLRSVLSVRRSRNLSRVTPSAPSRTPSSTGWNRPRTRSAWWRISQASLARTATRSTCSSRRAYSKPKPAVSRDRATSSIRSSSCWRNGRINAAAGGRGSAASTASTSALTSSGSSSTRSPSEGTSVRCRNEALRRTMRWPSASRANASRKWSSTCTRARNRAPASTRIPSGASDPDASSKWASAPTPAASASDALTSSDSSRAPPRRSDSASPGRKARTSSRLNAKRAGCRRSSSTADASAASPGCTR